MSQSEWWTILKFSSKLGKPAQAPTQCMLRNMLYDVLSKILMGTNLGSSSIMLRQTFSPLNCTPTHDHKRKSYRSKNLSRTSSWALDLTTCVWFCSYRTNSIFCHLATELDNTRPNIILDKKCKHAFAIKVIIPLMVSRHTDAAMFYSCKQSEELVICQVPTLNSSTHTIINKRKNLNLDINTTGNKDTNLTLWHNHMMSFAMEKQNVLLLLCVCILALVIWHASKCAVLYCHLCPVHLYYIVHIIS